MIVGIEDRSGSFGAGAGGGRVSGAGGQPARVDRYRIGSGVGAKSGDPSDARVLADMVPTDGHQHRPVAADNDLAEAVKLVAVASVGDLVAATPWPRSVPHVARVLPGGARCVRRADPSRRDVGAGVAPTELGKALSRSKIASALRRGVPQDQRRQARRGGDPEATLPPTTSPSLRWSPTPAARHRPASLVKVIAAHNTQIAELEGPRGHFGQHPDAEILRSPPGLGSRHRRPGARKEVQ